MIDIPLIILLISLTVALLGVGVWIYRLLSRPGACDPSPGKGSTKLGILYAFTLGMLPWKKESARLHWMVYLRGIAFHAGIFAGILALILSIFNVTSHAILSLALSVLMWLGVISGVAAIISRVADPMLRGISNADDYISPALISLFMTTGALHIVGLPGTVYFYIATSVLCLYLPRSKVRHCVYFFFSRGKIGAMMGRRGLLTVPDSRSRKVMR
jgi:nitrate reductase gamma subunit